MSQLTNSKQKKKSKSYLDCVTFYTCNNKNSQELVAIENRLQKALNFV